MPRRQTLIRAPELIQAPVLIYFAHPLDPALIQTGAYSGKYGNPILKFFSYSFINMAEKNVIFLKFEGCRNLDHYKISKCGKLSNIYQMVYIVPPTSVEAERAFSTTAYLCNKLRTKLN